MSVALPVSKENMITMKTLTIQIDETIFERVIAFLKLFPEERLKVVTPPSPGPCFDEAEQREIDDILRNPECFDAEDDIEDRNQQRT